MKQLSFCPASLMVIRCRNKGRNGDDLSFHNITVAHFVVHLAMPLANTKIGGIGGDVLNMTVALGGAECCILRPPRRTRLAKLRKPKLDQRAGNEWFTRDSDASPANDHHTPVQRQMREKHRAGNLLQHKRHRLLGTYQGVSIVSVCFPMFGKLIWLLSPTLCGCKGRTAVRKTTRVQL